MNILITETDNECELYITGRIDTVTSPELESTIKTHIKNSDIVTLNLKEVDYVSSAGLRVFLVSHKEMTDKKGVFKLKNVSPGVNEILEMTGFSKILTIE